jgi:hypothetical protein
LNELGQVAFRFTLFGGGQGLAVWTPPEPADFNDDGDIDGDDLAIWSANYGDPSATQPDGDASGDDLVDGADFLLWQRGVTSGMPGGAPVPEPAAWLLACAAAGLIVARSAGQNDRDR